MNRFVRTQLATNRNLRTAWKRSANHRRRVTDLLLDALPPGGELTVLGAGNLNDLDLGQLGGVASCIRLVDLDADAVAFGLARQRPGGGARVTIHAPVDLTRILDVLGEAEERDEIRRYVADRLAAVEHHPAGIDLPSADVTLSACVLTQMLQSVVEAELDPQTSVDLRLAVRDTHLHDLIGLTRPGGTIVLVTDVVATSTAPHLDCLAPSRLEPEMARLIAAGNFFTGTNPYRIVAVLESTPALATAVAGTRLVEPWLWSVTADRRHLTCAVVARRR